ncbi:lipocalin family protein [Rhizomicrobium electricum]|uniref:Outer membrane lipoprotein Blc n=1 Tax=Rhizomicrobium electricum TaxID=480070 RepID=A0ABN1F2Y3_9PROT|nr:lipocalin family protein [Rhizomicrobium electricum]NIJ49257.1 apolipoprotein D and lipocalin family protein [Rhizomicrobium electricum]
MGKSAGKAALIGMVLALAGCAAFSSRPVGNHNVPQPAKPVDLGRYLGRWYELYRYEAPFQKDCEAVTADYSLNPDGSIRVLNSCRQGTVDGPSKSATGKARVADTATNAKLRVTFFWPFYGDYWVLDHDADYQWSIVGEPSGRYLWVLSRSPEPSSDARAMLKRRVEELGYDWALVRPTKHRPGA